VGTIVGPGLDGRWWMVVGQDGQDTQLEQAGFWSLMDAPLAITAPRSMTEFDYHAMRSRRRFR